MQKKGFCSIEISDDGLALAYAQDVAKPGVLACEFYPFQAKSSNLDHVKKCLAEAVLRNNLRGVSCSWVLHPDYYHLTLINAPNVPQSEYKSAIRWQIKDLINYPIDDAAVDIFYPDEEEKRLKKLYVIVAQNSYLQNVIEIMQECQLVPGVIDIREFAIRNLLVKLAPENNSNGCVDIGNESSLLVNIHKRYLQFVRRIPVGLKSLRDTNYGELTSEMARSFTYCSTELKQPVPTKIFVPPSVNVDNSAVQNIARNLNREAKDVNIFSLGQVASFTAPLTLELESRCWVAVGGVLRK